MTAFTAPFMLLISMLLLLAGGVGLLEARTECTGLCFFADQVNAAATGVALVAVGLVNLFSALSLSTSSETSAVAKSTGTADSATNVYAELNKSHGVPSLEADTSPPNPRDDKSPGARRS